MDVPSPERCSRLTAHKALPKRRVVSDDTTSTSASPLRARSRRSYTSPTREARITSWIRDASPNLPLTPPDDREDANMAKGTSQEEDTSGGRTFYLDPLHEASGSTTPVNRQSTPPAATVTHCSPPTPDMTPPKKIRERKRSPSPPLRRRNRTSLSPPPTSRQVSSRAESFKTAAEQLSSPSLPPESAGSKAPIFSFQSPSPSNETPSRTRNTDSIGLGIGIVNGDGLRTPTQDIAMTLPEASPRIERDFGSQTATPVVGSDPVVASGASPVAELARADLLQPVCQDDEYQGFSYINDDDTPYKERPFFDEPTHLENGLAQSELESLRSVSPLSQESIVDDAILRHGKIRSSAKRMSEISSLSNTQPVEVMVIENPPVPYHKLRHASKNSSLRAASSSQGASNRSSLQSNSDYKPRLNRMLGKLPNATADSSLYSDSGISMVGSDHIMKRWSRLAVTDIPRRRPSVTQSLQYTASPKHNLAGTTSSVSRPATAPSGPDGSPELQSMRKRTISTSSSNSRGQDKHKERGPRGRPPLSGGPPVVPKRTSSLGAPTSREASGSSSRSSNADSGTGPSKAVANGRSVSQPVLTKQATEKQNPQPKARVQVEVKAVQKHVRNISQQSANTTAPLTPVITLSPTSEDDLASPTVPLSGRRSSEASDGNTPITQTGTPRRGSKEDAALLASRALLKTPFSGHSVQSGFSGTCEVHEATAINIYPHTNSSLLVIQQATPSTTNFPVHPGVRPGAYRITEISSPTSTERAQQPESMHIKIEGPDSSPSQKSEGFAQSPTMPYDSPLRNPRPAPKAPTSESGTVPSMKLIPPTPLDLPTPGERPATQGKLTVVNGPVSLMRRALSSGGRYRGESAPRTSGLWLASGRSNGGIKKKRSRPVIKDERLSPFWRPKKFWDDEDEYQDDEAGPSNASRARSDVGRPYSAATKQMNNTSDDYFSRPVRNTLGFPQSRLVITGPASLVRRLSSIRRHRSLKRKRFPPAMQPVRPLSPSSLGRAAPHPSSTQRRSSLPGGSNLISPVRVISPTPSAMARRRKSQKRSVRFDFNPMRALSGTSGESPGWATRAMRKRSEKKAEKQREKLKGTIGRPKLETVLE